jgi:hypothetical protein
MILSRQLMALLILGIAVGACRSRPVVASVSPDVWPPDDYCWWTNVRTTLPLDTVGRRFSGAFASLGLAPVVSRRLGDTVLVRGGPTALDITGRARYASRMVAYQVGDSTRFRWYWSIMPLADRAMTAAESASVGGRGIGFCGEIGKAVAIHGIGAREPTRDDSLAVWRRVP